MGATGMLFTTAFTYVGFGMLAVGSMWSANLCGKLREVRSPPEPSKGLILRA